MWLLYCGEVHLGISNAHVLPFVSRLSSRQHLIPDIQELIGDRVAVIVTDEDSIRGRLCGISPRDDVNQKTAFRQPIERRGHACGESCRRDSRPHGYKKLE